MLQVQDDKAYVDNIKRNISNLEGKFQDVSVDLSQKLKRYRAWQAVV